VFSTLDSYSPQQNIQQFAAPISNHIAFVPDQSKVLLSPSGFRQSSTASLDRVSFHGNQQNALVPVQQQNQGAMVPFGSEFNDPFSSQHVNAPVQRQMSTLSQQTAPPMGNFSNQSSFVASSSFYQQQGSISQPTLPSQMNHNPFGYGNQNQARPFGTPALAGIPQSANTSFSSFQQAPQQHMFSGGAMGGPISNYTARPMPNNNNPNTWSGYGVPQAQHDPFGLQRAQGSTSHQQFQNQDSLI
jgi:hypothetical protein